MFCAIFIRNPNLVAGPEECCKNKKFHTTEDLACYSHSNHQTESDRAAFERHMCTGREATKAAVGADAPTTKLNISANNKKITMYAPPWPIYTLHPHQHAVFTVDRT